MSCMMLGRVFRDESLAWRQRFPLGARDGRLGRCFQASEHPNSRRAQQHEPNGIKLAELSCNSLGTSSRSHASHVPKT